MRVAIIGAGDLGSLVARQMAGRSDVSCQGFYDDVQSPGIEVEGIPVKGKISSLASDWKSGFLDGFVIAIGYEHFEARDRLFRELVDQGVPAVSIIHETAIVSESVKIGAGSIVMAGCVFDEGASVGENCTINAGCVISHDSRISGNVFLGPGVTVSGFVKVETGVFLGVGSTLKNGITISSGVKIGAGAVVVKDTDEAGWYVGVPARQLDST